MGEGEFNAQVQLLVKEMENAGAEEVALGRTVLP